MIKYVLAENAITAENKSCYAVVSSQKTINLDKIITHMIEEGSGLTRPLALAYFERLTQSIIFYASQGYSITTPLIRIRPTICGTFDSKEDNYDPKRHQIKIRRTEGQQLREMNIEIKNVVKEKESVHNPVLNLFIDGDTDSEDSTVTSQGGGALYGKRMNFDKKDTRLGLFFVPENDQKKKVRVIYYSGIKPSEIHFTIPALPPGTYKLIAQTLSRNGKNILSGTLWTSLKVTE